MTSLPLSVRYTFEDDTHSLDVYDAGVALSGLSRTLAISIHYLINEKVIKQAPSLSGAKILLYPARPGSFVFDLGILLQEHPVATSFAISLTAGACIEFIKLIVQKTIGKDYTSRDALVSEVVQNKPNDIDAIIDTIEGDVASIHRPIIHNATNVILASGDVHIGTLNRESYNYVKTKITSDEPERFVGNVASFNANTGNGRFFIERFGRTIPFASAMETFESNEMTLLAWSLNEYVNGRPGLLDITANYTSKPGGLIKSFSVIEVDEHENTMLSR